MSNVTIQSRFHLDAWEIWRYIASDHVSRADAWAQSLYDTLELLATQSHMGTLHPVLKRGIRYFPFGRYFIIYKPLPDGILAMRLLHAARSFKKAWGA